MSLRLECIGRALVVLGIVVMPLELVLAQEPPPQSTQKTKPAPPSTSRPSDLPEDPEFRKAYEELLVAMRALERPTDEDIRAFDTRVADLAGRIAAGGQDAVAGRLYRAWAAELVGNRGRPQEALAACAQAAEFFRRLGDESGLVAIAGDRGNVFRSLSRYEEALTEYETAARMCEKLGDEKNLALITASRGGVFTLLSRYEEALSEYEKAARGLREAWGREKPRPDRREPRERLPIALALRGGARGVREGSGGLRGTRGRGKGRRFGP
jgi:tetratricopeptide (TPR) repeat protein